MSDQSSEDSLAPLRVPDDAATLAAFQAMGGGGRYLGNFAYVEGVVREFIAEVAEAADAGDLNRALKAADDWALRFARPSGEEVGIAEWHESGRLGLYITRHWPVEPGLNLVDTLRAMFLLVIERLISAMRSNAKGESSDEALRFVIDTTAEEMAATLTGTWEAVYPEEDDEGS